MMSEIKALRNSECWCVVQASKGYLIMQWEYYVVYCVEVFCRELNIWQRLIETIQELICLKGVLMIEIWLIQ